MDAGCPMADMVTAEKVREMRQAHPAAAVVCYVNSSAAVKAESDYCCTSSNAVELVRHIENTDIIFIPDSSSVNVLFEKFLKTKQHLAIVVDEYGTFVGVASFEDVIENLLGIEIVDETDTVEDLQKLAKEKWEERKRSMNG